MKNREEWFVEFRPYFALDEDVDYFYGKYRTKEDAEAAIYTAKDSMSDNIFYLRKVETKVTYTKTFSPLTNLRKYDIIQIQTNERK